MQLHISGLHPNLLPVTAVGFELRSPDMPADPSLAPRGILDGHGDAAARLAFVVDMMRDLSRKTDPQAMVANYGRRMREVIPADAHMSLSRRDLAAPAVRITRSSRWEPGVNPWKHKDR